jgi:Ca2+-binding EF-hand superfamily protein
MAERVKVIFAKYDTDGNGDMSPDELTNLLMTLNPNFTSQDCADLFSEIDVNNDGNIQYSEWVDWLNNITEGSKGAKAGIMLAKDDTDMVNAEKMNSSQRARLRGKFARLDKDGNGTLDFTEVYDLLHKRYPDMTLPDLKFLYDCADKSNDGALDFYELLDLFVSVPSQAQKGESETTKRKDSFAFNGTLQGAVHYRKDDKILKEAWEKYEKDQREMISLTQELCNELDRQADGIQKHKHFREAHTRNMRKHYAKTGQLRN